MHRVLALALLQFFLLCCGIVSCRKKEPQQPKEKVEDMLLRVDREQRALAWFVEDLRAILEWRQTLPVPLSEVERAKLFERLQKVTVEDGLSSEIAAPWIELLKVSEELLVPPAASDALLRHGSNLTSQLNAALARHGHPDVRL